MSIDYTESVAAVWSVRQPGSIGLFNELPAAAVRQQPKDLKVKITETRGVTRTNAEEN